MPAIATHALVKSFGDTHAVRSLSFAVEAGEIFGFLGRNGSGKTTTVRMLTTLSRPSAGTATVAGYDVVDQPGEVRARIGVTMQDAALDPAMIAAEHLTLAGRLWGLDKPSAASRGRELLALFGLSDAAEKRIGTFSGGMQRRLDIATSLIGEPEILFLDEPTTGLDPQSRRALWAEIRRLQGEGVTIFLTTQYLEEADQLADRLAVIDQGSIIATGTPASLKAEYGRREITAPASVDLGAVLPADAVTRRNGVLVVDVPTDQPIDPILTAMRAELGTLDEVTIAEADLEDVFMRLTGTDIAVGSGAAQQVAA